MIARYWENSASSSCLHVYDIPGDLWIEVHKSFHSDWYNPLSPDKADELLRCLGIRRREKWQEESYGWQAKVRWIER